MKINQFLCSFALAALIFSIQNPLVLLAAEPDEYPGGYAGYGYWQDDLTSGNECEETSEEETPETSWEGDVFEDADGNLYTTTLLGDTVSVSAQGYESALANGDSIALLAILMAQTKSFYWDGTILTQESGINEGPSGMETYYSLDMTGQLALLSENNIPGDYWIRNDGCQMYGGYILIATNYSLYPFGTLVETSLGTGIVADTCGPSDLIDIATTWAYE